MKFFRSERVSSLIQAELANLLIREIEFPHGTIATITSVDVDKKLERAKVRLSVIPTSASEAVLKLVNYHTKHLQGMLLRTINIKPMPHLMFEIDYGPENAAAVEKRLLETSEGG